MAFSDFRIRFQEGGADIGPVGKVVCVGRNYADHAKELNNPVPTEPVLFIKPATSLVALDEPLSIPGNQGQCHYETEVAVLIGERLSHCDIEQASNGIAGFGIALDLTLRELQSRLKEKSQSWEKAKGFDGACPVSTFVDPKTIADSRAIQLRMTLNNQVVQEASTADMLFPIEELLVYISKYFTLLPGDIVLTGTPAGVGPLNVGDQLVAELDEILKVQSHVIDADRGVG